MEWKKPSYKMLCTQHSERYEDLSKYAALKTHEGLIKYETRKI